MPRISIKIMSDLILVTGDPICDHHFYTGERATADSKKPRGFHVAAATGGGALLLHKLIQQVLKTEVAFDVQFGLKVKPAKLPSHYHSFCLWKPHVTNPKEKDEAKQARAWRAVQPLLGYGNLNNSAKPSALGTLRTDLEYPVILVVDDAGLDFREEKSQHRWPNFLRDPRNGCPRWIVLKLTGSIGDGALWSNLIKHCNNNLIVIVAAEQVRRSDIRLGQGLSWEATVEDLRQELAGNPALQPLRAARHIIVTFKSDGAFWLDNSAGQPPKAMLVFDGTRAEGDWAAAQGDGTVFGHLSCFTAAIVLELARAKGGSYPDLAAALGAGISATRELRRIGHGPFNIGDQGKNATIPGFPLKEIADCILSPKDNFVSTLLPAEINQALRGRWMMLDEWQVKARNTNKTRPYHQAAFACAVLGPLALERFPAAQFGDLFTVDRQEIENLRILHQLIADYEKDARRDAKPLNIGVFGPPGAGKSFGVREIVTAVLGKEAPFLTFNLSQFSNPQDLTGALHQVRDKVLKGTTPVVFWDEFDSQDYKWLQYLLAPMNDGVFLEGQITHPIGKCVFVFAGGTSPNFESFGPINPDDESDLLHDKMTDKIRRGATKQWKDFVLKKGPDFKSRLVTYLNVLGPNRRRQAVTLDADGQRRWEDDAADLCWPIRRAFFIRQKFNLQSETELKMDHGVLRALLEVHQYKLGARSLEFLCHFLRDQSKGDVPHRSHVPGHHLLNMHVNAMEFWQICERDLPFQPLGWALAHALHEAYRIRIKGRPDKKHLDVPFGKLSGDMQAANLGQAWRIPEILQIAGMKLAKGPIVHINRLVVKRTASEKLLRRRISEPATLELLAEAEHNGWMIERMLRGWRYNAKRDDAKLLHDNLIPYNQLAFDIQNYDRETIIGKPPPKHKPHLEQFGFLDLVKTAGFRVAHL